MARFINQNSIRSQASQFRALAFGAHSPRKYSSFSSHEDWWQYIMDLQRQGTQPGHSSLETQRPVSVFFVPFTCFFIRSKLEQTVLFLFACATIGVGRGRPGANATRKRGRSLQGHTTNGTRFAIRTVGGQCKRKRMLFGN